jgi:predicted hotdog family 3-hydroxylacyl-ACP dehydratase
MAFPPLEELLLLTAPMLWLDEVVALEANAVRCRLTPRAAHAFVRDGEVEALVALEWMGQAASCLAALQAHAAGARPSGRLIDTVLEARFDTACFRVGETLFIDARGEVDDSFACGVVRSDTRVASALMRLRERMSTAQSDPARGQSAP